MPARRLKLLMFAEGVTLAHVARPVALARLLDPARYEIVLACTPRYARFATDARWRRVDLNSVAPADFNDRLARGAPVYSHETLARYAAEDAALIAAERPDVVVGDFRLSLSVSARVARVPYLAIANAYWTPLAPPRYPMPVLPLSRALPLPLARTLFAIGRPIAFHQHCGPMNRLRRAHGLPGFGNDLRRAYSDCDHLLLPDVPALFPQVQLGEHASWIGPLAWAPPVSLPDWWSETASPGLPWVYVTLGSSGPTEALPVVLGTLADMPVRVMASTAGGSLPVRVPPNAWIAPYLPGDQAAARSNWMVCNGGSMGTQQALVAGAPVLGLATNMDQFLNMEPLVAAGAGAVLRTDCLNPQMLRAAVETVQSELAKTAALRIQAILEQPSVESALERVLARIGVTG
ncbi:glycosyltransferase [Aquabacterium sp. OR-4]|uniref:glycosyltransferase n=1 Tax=Aquabacterium sp. OR-4 TaxID=2978127 RepID=UPI0028CA27E6|nr:glycosyltransferase [Aquabacterium sp. OR-4]MDT7837690.1 glycosyltransferase [Aquabacterium sp. OR-4]